jgi:hypothetical protein
MALYSNRYLKSFILKNYETDNNCIIEGINIKNKPITVVGIDLYDDELPLICDVAFQDLQFSTSPYELKKSFKAVKYELETKECKEWIFDKKERK